MIVTNAIMAPENKKQKRNRKRKKKHQQQIKTGTKNQPLGLFFLDDSFQRAPRLRLNENEPEHYVVSVSSRRSLQFP